jgi:biopolymer transport protein ExbB/TolQ
MLALQAMRAAYSGIQYCCDCLREGTVEIQKVKKTVEGGVADARKIYAEVTGIWGWLQGLFKFTKPDDKFTKPAAPQAKPVAKEIAHIPDENEIVQQFIGHVGEWFDNYHTLKEHADKRYAEVFSKDVIDQKEVLELTQLQVELDSAYPALMTQMTTNAPWQLGPIWSQFKEMQDKVKAGQAARQMKQRRERAQKVAAAAQRRSDQIDRNMTWFWSIMLVSYFWVLMGTVWLSMTTTQ